MKICLIITALAWGSVAWGQASDEALPWRVEALALSRFSKQALQPVDSDSKTFSLINVGAGVERLLGSVDRVVTAGVGLRGALGSRLGEGFEAKLMPYASLAINRVNPRFPFGVSVVAGYDYHRDFLSNSSSTSGFYQEIGLLTSFKGELENLRLSYGRTWISGNPYHVNTLLCSVLFKVFPRSPRERSARRRGEIWYD